MPTNVRTTGNRSSSCRDSRGDEVGSAFPTPAGTTRGTTWRGSRRQESRGREQMDRRAWLIERRAAVESSYDSEAPSYDDDPYPVETQRRCIERLVAPCPPGGIVLDAPCGTGQYFALVAATGRRVVGIDQSAGMLEQARSKGIA